MKDGNVGFGKRKDLYGLRPSEKKLLCIHQADFMGIEAGFFFLAQADQFPQAGHVGIDVKASSVALRLPYGFCQGFHHIVFGFDPVAVVTGAKLLVDGTDARGLVDGALLLQGKV